MNISPTHLTRTALSNAGLTLQRNMRYAPPLVRRIGAALLRRLVTSPTIAGWQRTLVGDSPLGPPPQVPDRSLTALQLNDGSAPTALEQSLRISCLIVIGEMDAGGTEEVAAFLARGLPRYGIDVVIAHTKCGHAGGRLENILRQEGVKLVQTDESSARGLVTRLRPHVVSAHSAPAWWVDIAASCHVPFVDTLHGMHTHYNADWAQEAARSANVARFVAVSELVRKQYLNGNPSLGEHRIVTVPNSVDANRFKFPERRAARDWLGLGDEFLFVSLARHSYQKNTFGLVHAFADVAERYPQAHLLIAGRSDTHSYTRQIQSLSDGLPCRDRIHLRDHSPCTTALLAAGDAFVQNSFFEGWSLASMEALAAGLPVILSDVGGASEQVGVNGERGYLIANPFGNPIDVDWDAIRNMLYARQPNRSALISCMCDAVERRAYWAARRQNLQTESAWRFHPDHALRGHADVLRGCAAPPVDSS